jgi:endogenous inhibitor of DNA gyrase (YacG/DUF329 family)
MTAARACVTCGQTFQLDPRNPRRRFCTPRCRAADWRRRHNNEMTMATWPNDPNAVTTANAVTATNAVTPVNGVANDDRRAAVARCPHCHAPVAVLTLLVPPAAAHVATPPAHHG